MGNSGSSSEEPFWSSIAFIGVCIDRKTRQVEQFVEDESRRNIQVSRAIEDRRKLASKVATPLTQRSIRSPPLSARSRQSQADRDDHILLSARSIAIQKKAPLFRDNGEEEYLQTEWAPQLSARKLDMHSINELIERDRTSVSTSAKSTPRRN